MNETDERLVQAVEEHAIVLGSGEAGEYDRLIESARDKAFVLLGESSHGTADFYRARAAITKRLIEDHGFAAVAVEADWPDAYEINRYVWGRSPAGGAEEALGAFQRFPAWMWSNTEMLDFVSWLAEFNAPDKTATREARPAGFYGLDLYSMAASAYAVIAYLEKYDPPAAKRARERYACLDQFTNDPSISGLATEFGLSETCEQDIADQLLELQDQAWKRITNLGLIVGEQRFCAEQNARLVQNAREYYRAMFRGRPSSWNLRDGHMFETLEALRAHLSQQLGEDAKIVVWAHNSHIGNAAATEMSRRGEYNLGQLVRTKYPDDSLLVGLCTAEGEVTAASDWDAPAERKTVRTPLPGSYERVFQQARHRRFMLDLRADNEATRLLGEARLQRAIGVIYQPESERHSHYFQSRLPEQYDFILHFDHTEALVALEHEAAALIPDPVPGDTYPSGM